MGGVMMPGVQGVMVTAQRGIGDCECIQEGCIWLR